MYTLWSSFLPYLIFGRIFLHCWTFSLFDIFSLYSCFITFFKNPFMLLIRMSYILILIVLVIQLHLIVIPNYYFIFLIFLEVFLSDSSFKINEFSCFKIFLYLSIYLSIDHLRHLSIYNQIWNWVPGRMTVSSQDGPFLWLRYTGLSWFYHWGDANFCIKTLSCNKYHDVI